MSSIDENAKLDYEGLEYYDTRIKNWIDEQILDALPKNLIEELNNIVNGTE